LPTDLYGIVANEAEELAEVQAQKDLIAKYGRDMAKNPVMITGYGAGEETVKTNTAKYLKDAKHEGNAKHGKECGQLYIDAIGNVASAVYNLTNVIKLNTEFAIDEGQTVFTWTAADGFIACTKYINTEGNTIRAGAFSAKVPALKAKSFDPIKTKGAMAPNFVHSIDSAHLRMVVVACPHDLVTVHDSIGCHAGNYWTTSQIIREQFVAVHDYDALENLCSNMDQMVPDFEGDYHAREALKAPYIFS
jgi:DNA-directed RNA polymerase